MTDLFRLSRLSYSFLEGNLLLAPIKTLLFSFFSDLELLDISDGFCFLRLLFYSLSSRFF